MKRWYYCNVKLIRWEQESEYSERRPVFEITYSDFSGEQTTKHFNFNRMIQVVNMLGKNQWEVIRINDNDAWLKRYCK